MAEGALRNTATRWAWPTSRLSGRVTARRGTSNGSSKAISGRLEHLRASALGSRILTKHIARRLPTSEGQGPTTPLIGMSLFTSRFDAALWDEQLLRVFPNAPDGAAVPELRERVFGDLEKIRKLRNRIAHHEPIFNRQLEADLAAIHDLLTLRCVTATEVARSRDRVTALLEARPFQPGAR